MSYSKKPKQDAGVTLCKKLETYPAAIPYKHKNPDPRPIFGPFGTKEI